MTWYVRVPRVNGRLDFDLLIRKFESKGFGDRVEYHQGGWIDNMVGTTLPHLKFENGDDATAYILAYGGDVQRIIPCQVNYPNG